MWNTIGKTIALLSAVTLFGSVLPGCDKKQQPERPQNTVTAISPQDAHDSNVKTQESVLTPQEAPAVQVEAVLLEPVEQQAVPVVSAVEETTLQPEETALLQPSIETPLVAETDTASTPS